MAITVAGNALQVVGENTQPTAASTSIWKKQQDGSWKVVLDMGNASAAR